MLSNILEITTESLGNEVAALKHQGYRFVTITCVDLGEAFDILYHFDKNYQLRNLRLALPKGQPLPSITHVFFAAVLVENEIKDLFGIDVKDLVLDYEGRLLLAEGAPVAPQCRPCTPGVGMQITQKNSQ